MENLLLMKILEAVDETEKNLPNLNFGQVLLFFFGFLDQFQEISPICILHYQVKDIGLLVIDGLMVGDDVVTAEGSQEPDFVERVTFGLFVEGMNLNLGIRGSTFLMA